MAENFQAPGVVVRELRAGVPQIRGVPTSIGAFVIRSLRGPVNTAIRLDSPAKGQRIFGDYDPNSYWAEQVDGYFLNQGSGLYAVRALPTGGSGSNTEASLTLQNGGGGATSATKTTGAGPWNLEAGQTVTVDVDNAGVDTVTFDATAATVTGSGLSITDINGETVIVEMNDDGDTQTCTFAASHTGDPDGAAAEMNTKLTGCKVEVSGGQIKITSDLEGSDSEIDITGGTALTELGLSVGTTTGSGDVANIDAVTPLEFKTVWDTDTSSSTATVNANDTVTINSDTTGVSSELDFTGGTALTTFGLSVETITGTASTAAANSMVWEAVGPGSSYNSAKVRCEDEDNRIGLAGSVIASDVTAGATSSITLSNSLENKLTVGDQILLSDGSNFLRAVVAQISDAQIIFEASATATGTILAASAYLVLETFKATILEAGRTVQGPWTGLRMSSLSNKNYFATRVNTGDDEAIATVTDSGNSVGSNNTDIRPDNTLAAGDLLTGGSLMSTYQDADYIGVQASETGLYALDAKKDVRLVAVPGVTGVTTGAVSKGVLDYCTAREDCVAAVSTPAGTTVSNALTHKSSYLGTTSYGVMMYPWLEILMPLTSQKGTVPPEGFYMGMVARTDRDRNVAKAPAGERIGKLLGVLGVERELSEDDKAQLYPANINPIEDLDGDITVMGSRTMESGEFNQVNVRRTFIYLRESIRLGTRFVLFEPNDPATRAKVRRVVAAFLKTEWERGNLEGDTLDDAFFIICDQSNNPQNIINEGKMMMNIGVNIPKTTEFLVIEIMQDQRSLEAALAG